MRIADNVPALISYVDAERHYRFVNTTYAQWFATPPEQIVGRHLRDVLGAAAYATVLPHVERVLGGEVTSFELLIPYALGGTRYVRATYAPDIDAGGVVQGFVATVADITERHEAELAADRAQREAEASREQLQSLFMQAPALIAILRGREGVCELFNPMFVQLWGQRDVIGKPMREAWPELEGQGYFEIVEHVFDSGQAVYGNEYPSRIDRRDDGTLEDAYFNFVYAPFRDVAGRVDGVMIHGVEVTDQVRTRRAAELSEQRYRSLVEATSQLVWNTDSEGMVVDMPAWREMTGQTLEEVHGRGWLDAIHPDDREHVARIWDAAYSSRSLYAVEYRVRTRDSGWRWLSVRGVPIVDSAGNLVEWIGTGTDIDDDRRAEAAQRLLVEASAILAASLDEEETFRSVARIAMPNLADWCILDLRQSDGSLRRVAVEHIDSAKGALAREQETFHPHPPNPVYTAFETGQPVFFSEDAAPYVDDWFRDERHRRVILGLGLSSFMVIPLKARGETIGVLTFAFANGSRRYTERDLQLALELGERAAMAISSARLYRQAQDALRLRDEFLSSVTHDLRTPLTGILGMTQLLDRQLQPDRQVSPERFAASLNSIGMAAGKMLRLVGDLLDITRLQAGRPLDLNRQPADLVRVVAACVDEMARTAPSHRIVFDPVVTELSGSWDVERLDRVVANLISNSVKYSPAGSTISVRLTTDTGANPQAVLSVHDQGIGIPEGELPKIFDRYYRGSNVQGRTWGSGIGLAGTKQIVEQHGGSVAVESTEGCGAVFSVRLPLTGGTTQT